MSTLMTIPSSIPAADIVTFMEKVKSIMVVQKKITFSIDPLAPASDQDVMSAFDEVSRLYVCLALPFSKESIETLKTESVQIYTFLREMYIAAGSISEPLKILMYSLYFADVMTLAKCICFEFTLDGVIDQDLRHACKVLGVQVPLLEAENALLEVEKELLAIKMRLWKYEAVDKMSRSV